MAPLTGSAAVERGVVWRNDVIIASCGIVVAGVGGAEISPLPLLPAGLGEAGGWKPGRFDEPDEPEGSAGLAPSGEI